MSVLLSDAIQRHNEASERTYRKQLTNESGLVTSSNEAFCGKKEYSPFVRRIFNEAVFREAMLSLNEAVTADTGKGIPISYARQLHEDFIQTGMSYFSPETLTAFKSHKKSYVNMDNIAATNLAVALKAFLKDKTGYDNLDVLTPEGLSKVSQSVTDSFNKGFAPLSPYDSRFFMCEWALSSNGSAVYVPVGNRDSGLGSPSLCNKKGVPYMQSDMNDLYGQIVLYKEPDVNTRLGIDGRVLPENSDAPSMVLRSEDDLYGLSYLHRYIPSKNPESISDIDAWVKSSGFPMSETAIRSSAAILYHLNEKGIPYTIETDTSFTAGHVDAVTSNKTHIRVMSPSNWENNIGRCYNGGLVYYASTDQTVPKYEMGQDGRYRLENGKKVPVMRKGRNGESWQSVDRAEYAIPIEARMNVIDYAIGVVPDKKDLGKFGSYTANIYNSAMQKRIPTTQQQSFYHQTTKGHRMFRADIDSLPLSSFAFRNNRYQALGVDGMPLVYAPNNKPAQMSSTNKMHMVIDNKRRFYNQPFTSKSEAEDFIVRAVDSAKTSFIQAIDIDRLLDDADTKGSDYVPVFDEDSIVSEVQRSFWALIRQAQDDDGLDYDRELTRERLMQQLTDDFLPERIGYFNTADDCLINPLLVARYMSITNDAGDISDKALSSALITAGVSRDRFVGDGSTFNAFCEKLVQFDENSATSLKVLLESYPEDSPQRDILQSVCDSLTNAISTTGCDFNLANDAFMDANGIIRYKARKVIVHDLKESMVSKNLSYEEVEGTIGQVFLPDGVGLIETKFNHDDNYLFVPDYEADILPQKPGENKTYEERMRLRGYKDVLHDFITARVRSDIVLGDSDYESNTALNRTYRMLRSERFPLDVFAHNKRIGLDPKLFADRIYTLSRKIHFPSEYKDSTIRAFSSYASMEHSGLENDLDITNPFTRSGKVDLSILTNNGYTSPTMTSNNTSQGLNRFLSDGAVINPDGSVTPTDDEEQKEVRLVKNHMPFAEYSTADRNIMGGSNLLSCLFVTEAEALFTNCGGSNMNDAVVMSKEFAEANPVEDVDGNMRPLAIGDKGSTIAGNKMTTSVIIDRNWSEREAMAYGYYEDWKILKDNPTVDIIAHPSSFVGRLDGYTTREAMAANAEGRVSDNGVAHINGKDIPGARIRIKYIITNMTVDNKAHYYDNDSNEGRSLSAQLTAALIANGAKDVVQYFKGADSSYFERLRESLIPLGFDIDEYAGMHFGYKDHENENRRIIRLPELKYMTNENDERVLDEDSMRDDMFSQLNSYGGFMEVPFQMTLPSGASLMESYGDDGKPNGNYLLPVLPPYLRSGFDGDGDGPDIYHGYTYAYQRIMMNSLRYKALQENQNSVEDYGKQAGLRASIEKEYKTSITDDLEKRVFHSKHGLCKEAMTRRLPNSATAVWVANPRAKLEDVYISSKMAEHLGVQDGDYVAVWRDPILSDGGIRAMKVHIDSDYGDAIGINPLIAKSFAGDFDGDTVAVVKIDNVKALSAFIKHFGLVYNALDEHYIAEDGKYDLYFDMGLDVQAVLHEHPDLAQRASDIRDEFNDNLAVRDENFIEWMRLSEETFEKFNDLSIDIFDAAYGVNTIQFNSLADHFRSAVACIENKSKGKPSSIDQYARNLGIKFDAIRDDDGTIMLDENGKFMIDYDSIVDMGHTLSEQKDREASQTAMSAKNHFTGSYGRFTQDIIAATLSAFMDGETACDGKSACRAGMHLSEGMTQSALSAKHNVEQALRLIYNVSGENAPLRALWSGRPVTTSVDANDNPVWVADRSRDNVRLSPSEWREQFKAFATSPFGGNSPVNEKFIHLMSRAMTVKDDKGQEYICGLNNLSKYRSELLEQAYHPSMKKLSEDIIAHGGNCNLYGVDVSAVQRACAGVEDPVEAKDRFDTALDNGNVAYVYMPNVVQNNIFYLAAARGFNKLHANDKRIQRQFDNGDYQVQTVGAKAANAARKPASIRVSEDSCFHSVSQRSTLPDVPVGAGHPDDPGSPDF